MYLIPDRSQRVIVKKRPVQFENNIISNFYYLYCLSRISGLNGFELPTHRAGSVRLTKFILLFSLTFVILVAINSLFNARNNINFDFSQSIIVNLGFSMAMGVVALQCFLLIVSDILNRKKIWKVLTECYDFDQQVRDVNNDPILRF